MCTAPTPVVTVAVGEVSSTTRNRIQNRFLDIGDVPALGAKKELGCRDWAAMLMCFRRFGESIRREKEIATSHRDEASIL